jgi:hypothetical protein
MELNSKRQALVCVAAAMLCGTSAAADLVRWDQSTLYAQLTVTDALLDSVQFSVDSPGSVGVAVAIRSWDYSTNSTIGSFWSALTELGTGAQIAFNIGHFFPNVGGVYFINPMQLSAGNYKATVSFNLHGTGVAEIDVVSYVAPYASLAPIQSVPEPATPALSLAGIAVAVLAAKSAILKSKPKICNVV